MRAKIAHSEPFSWPPSTIQPNQERRRRPRLSLALPVVLTRPGTEAAIDAMTENISSEGFYCHTASEFWTDEILNCEVSLPGDQVSSVPEDGLRLSCEVRVVRVVSRGAQQGFGVACHLEDYTMTRSAIESPRE
jgi:PilZ domain